jgi:C1A family cysteine protease
MKYTLALLGAVAAVDAEVETAYMSYLSQHGKSYATREEYQFRLNIFDKNLKYIKEVNANAVDEHDHHLGLNHMADWTQHEYKKLLGYKSHMKKSRPMRANYNETVADVPASIDWRDQGAVTPVKNQGSCGSCWSFSTTGSMEGRYQIKTGNLVSMSEQQLVDCSTSFGNEGCNGGLMDQAFEYVEQTAIDTESSYPYKGTDGTCHNTSGEAVAKVTSYQDVT